MTIVPKQNTCAACGKDASVAFIGACSQDCLRTGAKQFFDGTTFSSEPKVHLHVTCRVCGFVWLNAVVNPDQVAAAW